MTDETERTTLNTVTGGGCACGCCGDTADNADEQSKSQDEELTELRQVREQIQRRLAELGAE